MKKLLWRLFLIFSIILVLAVGGAALYANHLLKKTLDPANLVQELESQCNLRMDIGSVNYRLFSLESGIHIQDFRLAPRDEDANQGKPLSERSALDPSKALLSTSSAELKIETKDLLRGKLNVKSVIFHEPEIIVTIDQKGRSDFAQLFKKPNIVNGVPRVKKPRDPNAPKPPPRPFSTDTGQEAVHVQIDRASIENASLKIVNPREKRLIEAKNFNFVIDDLLVDPDRLETRNEGKLLIESQFSIVEGGDEMIAQIPVRLTGLLTPVSPTTGTFNPSFEGEFQISERAELKEWQLSKFLGGKGSGDKIKDTLNDFFRLKTKEIMIGGKILKPIQTRVRIVQGKVELLSECSLNLAIGEFRLEEGSYYDPVEKHLKTDGAILLSEDLSQSALKGMDLSIEEKVGGFGLMAVKTFALDFLLDNPKIYQNQKLRLGFTVDGSTEEKITPDWDVWKDLKREILGRIF